MLKGCRGTSACQCHKMDCTVRGCKSWSSPVSAEELLLHCLEHLLSSFSPVLPSAELFLSCIPQDIISEALPPLRMDSALASGESFLDLAGTTLVDVGQLVASSPRCSPHCLLALEPSPTQAQYRHREPGGGKWKHSSTEKRVAGSGGLSTGRSVKGNVTTLPGEGKWPG